MLLFSSIHHPSSVVATIVLLLLGCFIVGDNIMSSSVVTAVVNNNGTSLRTTTAARRRRRREEATRQQVVAAVTITTTTTVPEREFSVQWLSSLFSLDNDDDNNEQHQHSAQRQKKRRRRLPVTGDVWKACSGNTTTGQQIVSQNATEYTASIYEHMDYDDAHSPACTCFYDAFANNYWSQCALGDTTCDSDGKGCTRTHEYFLFSAVSGGLAQKSSCKMCTNPNDCPSDIYGNPREKCTLVVFDDTTGDPLECIIKRFQDDGSQERCDRCRICQDENGKKGIAHSCDIFGPFPAGVCDTAEKAHQHNFQPIVDTANRIPIGGAFRSVCKNPEQELYGAVKNRYDDGYQTRCECPDPTQGIVACDLYTSAAAAAAGEDGSSGSSSSSCFANECTVVSESFLFDDDGRLFEKTTCDYDTKDGYTINLCTTVLFSTSGVPIGCFPRNLHESSSQEDTTCETCSICKDEQGTYGISHHCFGTTTASQCLVTHGRAIYNLDKPLPKPQSGAQVKLPSLPQSSQQPPPSTATKIGRGDEDPYFEESTPVNGIAKSQNNKNNNQTPLVLGIVLGGLAVILSVTLLVVALYPKCTRSRFASASREEVVVVAVVTKSGGFDDENGTINLPAHHYDDDEPPSVLVDQTGEPMVEDPTPIKIA